MSATYDTPARRSARLAAILLAVLTWPIMGLSLLVTCLTSAILVFIVALESVILTPLFWLHRSTRRSLLSLGRECLSEWGWLWQVRPWS
jgi:hypothetical protein